MDRKKDSRSSAETFGSIDGESSDPGAMSPAKRSRSYGAAGVWKMEWNLWLMRARNVSDSAAEADSRSAISNCDCQRMSP